ncbi:MAG: DUF1538 domain-containing protein [Bacillales bacterium]|jgi:hypothetical protein|nr:DUF1538 domain-containing protein [Bacillales bacterium]
MKFLKTLKEVFLSSLPLLIVIIALCGFIFPFPDIENFFKVFGGYVIVILGQTIFLIGLENSILPIGRLVGGSLTKLKKIIWVIMFGLLFGTVATVAEPSLSVIASQFGQINSFVNPTLFIWILSFGVGASVALALFRVIKNWNIKILFAVAYSVVSICAWFTPAQYRAIAFDAAGATTGDISVPFILAFGLGISATASKHKTNDETFGIVGIASIGPIVALFIYGIIIGPNPNLNTFDPATTQSFLEIFFGNVLNVLLAILPIIVIFLVFQFFFIKLSKKSLTRILLSSIVVFAGLLIFLVGIDFGFAIAGEHIGNSFMTNPNPWKTFFLILVTMLLGFTIAITEPAVSVLGDQVEEITNGAIKKITLKLAVAIGIALAALFTLINILLPDVSILWTLMPLYAIALILMIWCPNMFVGLAFDSGGVTGGAITSAFLVPLTLGVSQAMGQDILVNGFGIIGYISALPLLSVEILGIIYTRKLKKQEKAKQDLKDSIKLALEENAKKEI